MIILRLLLLLTNLHLKLLSTQGTGADKLLSTQRVKQQTQNILNFCHAFGILVFLTSGSVMRVGYLLIKKY